MKLQQWLWKNDQAKLDGTCTHHFQAIQKNSIGFWSSVVQLFSYSQRNLHMIVFFFYLVQLQVLNSN